MTQDARKQAPPTKRTSTTSKTAQGALQRRLRQLGNGERIKAAFWTLVGWIIGQVLGGSPVELLSELLRILLSA